MFQFDLLTDFLSAPITHLKQRRLAMVFTSSNGPLARWEQWSGRGQVGKKLRGRVVEMGEDFKCPGKDGRR